MVLTETYHGRKPEAALSYLLGSVGGSAELGASSMGRKDQRLGQKEVQLTF